MTPPLLLLLPLILGAPDVIPSAPYAIRSVPLPGGSDQGISMDYVAYDARTGFLWVPAGNTGAVDVIDTAHGNTVTQVSGFPTAEVQARAGKRVVGPSSATLGEGTVYVGNRGDSTVCALDARSLARGACGRLDSTPDGLAYVASTKEVWVTTPRDHSVRILDAGTLGQKARLAFDGQPEGFAVDETRGRFYTNLEDKDRTLGVDLRTHATVSTWNPSCGEDGPHGLRLDEKAGFLFVACSARAEVLDVGHGGAVLSSVDTGMASTTSTTRPVLGSSTWRPPGPGN
jgi:DNA-binding beta-propeller fold protein YncE